MLETWQRSVPFILQITTVITVIKYPQTILNAVFFFVGHPCIPVPTYLKATQNQITKLGFQKQLDKSHNHFICTRNCSFRFETDTRLRLLPPLLHTVGKFFSARRLLKLFLFLAFSNDASYLNVNIYHLSK